MRKQSTIEGVHDKIELLALLKELEQMEEKTSRLKPLLEAMLSKIPKEKK